MTAKKLIPIWPDPSVYTDQEPAVYQEVTAERAKELLAWGTDGHRPFHDKPPAGWKQHPLYEPEQDSEATTTEAPEDASTAPTED